MSLVIALDVGGTTIKSGLVVAGGRIIGEIFDTPALSHADAETILGTFAEIVREHLAQIGAAKWLGIAFGFPSPFEYDLGVARITGLNKFEAIYGINVADDLRSRVDIGGRPILFRNDAEAAIIGECVYGAGRRYKKLIGITLGTGLGSSFVENGIRLSSGPGIPPDGFLFPEKVRDVRADDVFSKRGLEQRLAHFGVTDDIPAAADLARMSHEMARSIFADFGTDLGRFLRKYAEKFGAEAVLVLGGIANTFDLFGPALKKSLDIPVVLGERPEEAALLGAAELIFRD